MNKQKNASGKFHFMRGLGKQNKPTGSDAAPIAQRRSTRCAKGDLKCININSIKEHTSISKLKYPIYFKFPIRYSICCPSCLKEIKRILKMPSNVGYFSVCCDVCSKKL